MKEFIKTQKVTYNLMSFTGFKALLIFSMLIESPKSFEDIQKAIENQQYLHEKISIDTMRVYINSLKRIGCEIKRIKGEDKVSRYYITSHPFELSVSQEQKDSLLKVYKSLVKSMDIQDVLYMDKFLEKIGKYIKDQEFVNKIKNISMMKDIDRDILETLVKCVENKNQVVLKYQSPNSGIKNIELIAKNFDINNGKIYLKAFGFEYQQTTNFLVSRIKEILEIKTPEIDPESGKELKVLFEIKNYKNYTSAADEQIVEKRENSIVVEKVCDNKFYLKQRILELGPSCTILEPESFKNEIIELLKNMKAGYCD